MAIREEFSRTAFVFGEDAEQKLKSVYIPGSVKEIENGAFSNCYTLETVIISEGVEIIGENAFEQCLSLQKVIIPESVKEIGANAFYGVGSVCFKIPENAVPEECDWSEDYLGCAEIKWEFEN